MYARDRVFPEKRVHLVYSPLQPGLRLVASGSVPKTERVSAFRHKHMQRRAHHNNADTACAPS